MMEYLEYIEKTIRCSTLKITEFSKLNQWLIKILMVIYIFVVTACYFETELYWVKITSPK